MSDFKHFLRSLRAALLHNRPSLIVILLSWAGIAFIAWAPMDITGNYWAGFKAGTVFVLVIFGIVITVGFIVRVIRKAVHL